MNTTQIGDITEQKFVLYCLEKEIPISKPVGNNLPYDFIIEYNNQLLKIQVKTARQSPTSNDTITFNTRSCSKNYNEITTSNYIDTIDYFVTYWDSYWYFVHISQAAKSEHRIFIGENPKPNQKKFIIKILFYYKKGFKAYQ